MMHLACYRLQPNIFLGHELEEMRGFWLENCVGLSFFGRIRVASAAASSFACCSIVPLWLLSFQSVFQCTSPFWSSVPCASTFGPDLRVTCLCGATAGKHVLIVDHLVGVASGLQKGAWFSDCRKSFLGSLATTCRMSGVNRDTLRLRLHGIMASPPATELRGALVWGQQYCESAKRTAFLRWLYLLS